MQAVVRFLAQLEIPIYLILGVVAIVYVRRLILSIEERRQAVFGLERDVAQSRIARSATVLILIGILTMAEFVVATFMATRLSDEPSFATPTPELTPTLKVTSTPGEIPEDATPTPTPFPQLEDPAINSQCQYGVLEITSPKHHDEISGVVEIKGSVNTPSFGSYVYDYSTMGQPDWQTIAAGSQAGIDKNLGFWYTSSLVPGDYMLRLVALDNQGNEQQACVIVVKVLETK